MSVEGGLFRSGSSFDPNVWVRVYVPGFDVDSGGYACFETETETEGAAETEGAGGGIAKVLLNVVREQIQVLTGAGVA